MPLRVRRSARRVGGHSSSYAERISDSVGLGKDFFSFPGFSSLAFFVFFGFFSCSGPPSFFFLEGAT